MKTMRVITILWMCHILLGMFPAKNGFAADPNTQSQALKQAGERVVHLYFNHKNIAFLASEQRVIVQSNDLIEFGKSIMTALLKGPKGDLMRTIPNGTALRAFYFTIDGTAFVDLNQNVAGNHPGGIQSEILTIYSIVNSLILNIAEVKTVRILIEGGESLTLAGHVDIRFPFKANMLLIR
ncbi:MAG: GerMN domain-containing protein [Desulfobacterales bacterium]|jgi:spore germination protein GerM